MYSWTMKPTKQTELSKETLGSALNFLKENMDVKIMIYDNRVLGVDLPNTVELTVVETEPGIKGDTATGGSKNATMDTGYVVKVPLFTTRATFWLSIPEPATTFPALNFN